MLGKYYTYCSILNTTACRTIYGCADPTLCMNIGMILEKKNIGYRKNKLQHRHDEKCICYDGAVKANNCRRNKQWKQWINSTNCWTIFHVCKRGVLMLNWTFQASLANILSTRELSLVCTKQVVDSFRNIKRSSSESNSWDLMTPCVSHVMTVWQHTG